MGTYETAVFSHALYSLIILFLYGRKTPCLASSLCFGIIVGTLLIPVLFYAYTAVLGKNIFLLDIGTFILSVLTAFLLSCRFTLSCRLKPYTFPLCLLVGIFFLCFLRFTYHPPALKIFESP